MLTSSIRKWTTKLEPFGLTWLLDQDHASAHRAGITMAYMHKVGIKLLTHPLYKPNLAPCEFVLIVDRPTTTPRTDVSSLSLHNTDISISRNNFPLPVDRRASNSIPIEAQLSNARTVVDATRRPRFVYNWSPAGGAPAAPRPAPAPAPRITI
ncbi:hypothetical protein EVAR_25076_1 [Eumeta japonica]|uniref:Mariner Mos1 transposase n=1 Tax=Eumeta variegata TaxID=151549 RepID=A0A4C1YXE2_EUMVA|nr:hypothetical protein EVAR_25076_1 [Eumeta japonica]